MYERLQDQGFLPTLQSIHLSVSRSRSVASEYTRCIKVYVGEDNFIFIRPRLRNQAKLIFYCNKSVMGKIDRSSLVLLLCDSEVQPVL